jgi:selenocysteine lyase/cysteine desulfurase
MRLDELTRQDFPILQRIVNGHPLVYFDSGASSQKPRAVLEAMNRYYERSHANVHRSIHTLGEEATELYELARDSVQRFIGAPSREEVVFTRGTTDGLGLIAETIGRTLGQGDEILVTELEHHSNLIPWQLVARDRGASLKADPRRRHARFHGPRPFAHRANARGGVHPRLQRGGNDQPRRRGGAAGSRRQRLHRGGRGSGGSSSSARYVSARV